MRITDDEPPDEAEKPDHFGRQHRHDDAPSIACDCRGRLMAGDGTIAPTSLPSSAKRASRPLAGRMVRKSARFSLAMRIWWGHVILDAWHHPARAGLGQMTPPPRHQDAV